MNEEDPRFETFLREFEPRPPRPLPATRSVWRSWPRLAAAAALILAIGSISLWIGLRQRESRRAVGQSSAPSLSASSTNRPPSTIALTQAAIDDGPEFEQQMDAMSRRSLPGFARKDSTLRVLAKD